jgi:phage shock protein A
MVHQLKLLRQETQEKEVEFQEKQKIYHVAILSVDSEAWSLEQQVSSLNQEMKQWTEQHDRLKNEWTELETKYGTVDSLLIGIGGDQQERWKNYKSTVETFQKRMSELDHLQSSHMHTLEQLEAHHDLNVKQAKLMTYLEQFMRHKWNWNQKRLGDVQSAKVPFLRVSC